jgi:hypothetical protein
MSARTAIAKIHNITENMDAAALDLLCDRLEALLAAPDPRADHSGSASVSGSQAASAAKPRAADIL